MNNSIELRPSYWASVSGGKDSLYMLNYILHNLDRYPLDGVMHFELEIDFPFIKDVIDYMEAECKRFKIPFFRVRPRKTWQELYDRYGYPTRTARWCNSEYKLDASRQMREMLLSKGEKLISYIGYCADETDRVSRRKKSDRCTEVYPLVDAGINEDAILEWAKGQPIFNNYYVFNKRCGCMGCPMSSYIGWAYLREYYPDKYEFFVNMMHETEKTRSAELGRPFSAVSSNPKYDSWYLDAIVATKYTKQLRDISRDRSIHNLIDAMHEKERLS